MLSNLPFLPGIPCGRAGQSTPSDAFEASAWITRKEHEEVAFDGRGGAVDGRGENPEDSATNRQPEEDP